MTYNDRFRQVSLPLPAQHLLRTFSPGLFILLLIFLALSRKAYGEIVVWDIDPARSSLTFSVDIYGPGNQLLGSLVEQSAGSLTTSLQSEDFVNPPGIFTNVKRNGVTPVSIEFEPVVAPLFGFIRFAEAIDHGSFLPGDNKGSSTPAPGNFAGNVTVAGLGTVESVFRNYSATPISGVLPVVDEGGGLFRVD